MKLIKILAKAINDWANPEDSAELSEWRSEKQKYDHAEKIRNIITRSPVRKHTIDDIADFYIKDEMFCFPIKRWKIMLSLDASTRLDFMKSLRSMIDKTCKDHIERYPNVPRD